MKSMKISVLTPTYNRANLLKRLYESLLKQDSKIEVEWIIMDDGSTDNTEDVVDNFSKEKRIDIKYFKQENSGKMSAINNIVEKATGEIIIECDSDDFFSDRAFNIIGQAYNQNKERTDLYAMCFLKSDLEGNIIGNDLNNKETTMFDLYFKQKENGDKALVYFANIRKKYKYKLEKNERFVTEARLHHEMDLNYKIVCYNECVMICEYQQDGYTKNIQKVFKENPFGYYEYFKEILNRNMTGVTWNKRLYVIKHYILFSYLTKQKLNTKCVKDVFNKFLLYLLYLPGILKSMNFVKNEKITR